MVLKIRKPTNKNMSRTHAQPAPAEEDQGFCLDPSRMAMQETRQRHKTKSDRFRHRLGAMHALRIRNHEMIRKDCVEPTCAVDRTGPLRTACESVHDSQTS